VYQQPIYSTPPGGYYAQPAQSYPQSQGLASAGTPKVRFQKPDEPPASERTSAAKPTLTLPPPEDLASNDTTAPADIDLNALYRRLDELGAQSTEVSRTQGGYAFVCKLATADHSRTERIEERGVTRAEAARRLLARAEQWAQVR
jgi:hypothetical protein